MYGGICACICSLCSRFLKQNDALSGMCQMGIDLGSVRPCDDYYIHFIDGIKTKLDYA